MPVSGDLGGGGGSWCPVSPSDMVGTINNLMSRIEQLEQDMAELKAQNTTAAQLSDFANAAGWIDNVTYLGMPGWTQTPSGTLIPPAGFSLSPILDDALARDQLGYSGVSAGVFSWAQLTINASGGAITSISELYDSNNIVSVSSPTVTITTSGLYGFFCWDTIGINVTSAASSIVSLTDNSFSLPGQAAVIKVGLTMTSTTSGTKNANVGSGLITTIPSGSFNLTASISQTGGTWTHIVAVSILKLS